MTNNNTAQDPEDIYNGNIQMSEVDDDEVDDDAVDDDEVDDDEVDDDDDVYYNLLKKYLASADGDLMGARASWCFHWDGFVNTDKMKSQWSEFHKMLETES